MFGGLGLALGLAAVNRPQNLLLAAFILVWLWWRGNKTGAVPYRWLGLALAALLVALLVIPSVQAGQYSIGGGIGQARTYMYLLRTAHLGEVTDELVALDHAVAAHRGAEAGGEAEGADLGVPLEAAGGFHVLVRDPERAVVRRIDADRGVIAPAVTARL